MEETGLSLYGEMIQTDLSHVNTLFSLFLLTFCKPIETGDENEKRIG